MDPILQLNEFFVEGGHQDQSHVLLHITEPSTPEEQSKGYFFAICEINNAAQKYITKLQDIIDSAENAYYGTEPTAEKSVLEIILEKINQEAFALVDDEVELHCIIGAIAEPTITFTYHGHPQALMFYRHKQGLYQKIDLIAQNPEDTSGPTTQLFSDVIEGKISVHDYLFLATPHLTNYFTHDRIQKIVTVREASQSAQHFEHVLSELREGYSFGGLVIHRHVPQPAAAPVKKSRPQPSGGSEQSMQALFNTQHNTTATLSPALFPRVPDKPPLFPPRPDRPSSAPIANKSGRVHPPAATQNTTIAQGDRLLTFLRRITPLFSAVGRGLLWGILFLYTAVVGLLKNFILLIFVATNYQNRRKLIVDEWRRHWRSRKQTFEQLPILTKVIALLVVLAVVTFAVGVSIVRVRARQAAEIAAYQSALSQIKSKRDAAESNLIYRNEPAALAELQGAETLLASLPCSTKEEKTNCTNLANDLETLAGRLRKISSVSAELLTTIPSFTSSTMSLVRINDTLLAVSSNSTAIMSFNLSTKNTAIAGNGQSGFIALTAPKENDFVLLETVAHTLVRYDPATGNTSSSVISFPHSAASMNSLVVYNRRLYTLDPADGQIYRHTTIRDGYDIGKDWIKTAGVDLSNAVALTVDGDMYVLKANGQVAKFSSGVYQSDFAVTTIDPPLTAASRIWTYTDAHNIYILDSTGKRIIVIDKTGQLKQQITSPQFVHPTDFVIDEAARTAYVADNGNIYKVPLSF